MMPACCLLRRGYDTLYAFFAATLCCVRMLLLLLTVLLVLVLVQEMPLVRVVLVDPFIPSV